MIHESLKLEAQPHPVSRSAGSDPCRGIASCAVGLSSPLPIFVVAKLGQWTFADLNLLALASGAPLPR